MTDTHGLPREAVDETPIDEVLVTEWKHWEDGPPYELFKRLRAECPVHWSDRIVEYPEEAGFWSDPRAW